MPGEIIGQAVDSSRGVLKLIIITHECLYVQCHFLQHVIIVLHVEDFTQGSVVSKNQELVDAVEPEGTLGASQIAHHCLAIDRGSLASQRV